MAMEPGRRRDNKNKRYTRSTVNLNVVRAQTGFAGRWAELSLMQRKAVDSKSAYPLVNAHSA